jgi:hypothetical protein
MTKLKIDDNTARRLYPAASQEMKAIFEESFPEGFFNQSIIDRTPTVEAALAIAGKTIEELTRPTDSPHETSLRIIETVIKVLWEGVPADHSNTNQDKYEPRFYYKAGLGLSYCGYGSWRTCTRCGPRLCYPSYDTMLHGVTILEKYYSIYNKY